jgi:alkaline phosphatase D
LLLGDNTYIDDPESQAMQRYTYYRRQSRPEFRRLTASTPVFSIWDDHDFGTNDCWGGPLVNVPAWKREVWRTWKQNWPNPGFGGGEQLPGVWYTFSHGDVDFVMLDCRYYRTSPRAEAPSMLGPRQLKWLKQSLKQASGTFKVLCSSVPWDFRTKGDSRDTWNGYQDQREEIFQFIEQEKIEGVLLMSADRHRSDAWCIERPQAYDLYEFNSSRLTNQHVHPTMESKGAIFSYNAKQSFGVVTFDTTSSDPQATYAVINIEGDKIDELTVHRSQLSAAP